MKIIANRLEIFIGGGYREYTEKEVEDALEKQIPKKVIEQTEEDREFIDYDCPCCKTILQQCIKPGRKLRFHGRTIYKYKRCPYCGQALDWSEINATP